MTLSKDTKPLYPYSVDKHFFFNAGDIELVINRSVLLVYDFSRRILSSPSLKSRYLSVV